MDGKISVYIKDHWSTRFDCSDERRFPIKFNKCGYCDVRIDNIYSFIIDSLKNAGLLNKDYKEICCYCFVLKKFRLMGFRKGLRHIHYNRDEDILKIECYTPGGFAPDHRFYVRIHNYSKVC